MRTQIRPGDPPRDDRLERLLRAGGAPAESNDRAPAGVATDDPGQDQEDDVEPWTPPAGTGSAAHGTSDGLVRGRHRVDQVPLLTVPESLRSSELRVGMRAVRGLLVLVVVAALVLGGRWLWTQRVAAASPADRVATSGSGGGGQVGAADRSTEDGQQEGGGTGEGELAGAADTPVAGGAAASAEGEGTGGGSGADGLPDASPAAAGLVVHVAGEVLQPGVVELPAGSRVVDAVRSAGGVTDAADQSTLNLARPLVDGERVWVGRPGETPPPVAPGPVPSSGSGGAGGGVGAGAGGGVTAAPLDLNAATQADLEELPGIGPVTAGHILGWRDEHGRFSSVDELLEVSGIGERTLAQLEPLVTVGG